MSLDFCIETKCCEHELTSRNITHNLKSMFQEAKIHDLLWRGDGKKAEELIRPLEEGLMLMESDRKRFEAFESKNGWGKYTDALEFLRGVIVDCKRYPDGIVRCSV